MPTFGGCELFRMAKLTLDFYEDYNFDLIGICSHVKDYRLVWALNNSLEFDFVKEDNYDLNLKGETQSHSYYEYIDDENALQYSLINNHSDSGYLIPEEKSCDYLLVIKGMLVDELREEMVKRIAQIKHVLTAYTVDVNELKSKENLLF